MKAILFADGAARGNPGPAAYAYVIAREGQPPIEEAGLLVLTRAQAPEQNYLLTQVRQAMETSFSQLWYQFMDRVFSRSWRGLWNTIQLKVLHYNLRQAGVLPA